ncbi:probable E3 ubiquitin-protein ligase LUL4 [Lycium ferocissimum]|uniref:probable E3 ubiquitin-protein ligase LUL4 n=1 Tax=Lycium ferocissimum TaxID=112874 RepID=UPI002815D00D|nr:probable E3 ubiquitin-protein ligase LUL4 [Lycium ferocissimum]
MRVKVESASFSTDKHKIEGVLNYIHSDLWGPSQVPSKDGKRYLLTFIDDFSRKCGRKIKCLRTDNGLEFCNEEFDNFCKIHGVLRHRTVRHTPQYNGIAERMNRTLLKKARCMLSNAKVPKEFWVEVVNTACYVVNVLQHRRLTSKLQMRYGQFYFLLFFDCSITIFYFAKEGDCKFSPVYPEIKPFQIPFKKGLGQKFCQPSGTGVDLGFFDVNDLSKPTQGEEIFPLVISAESCLPSTPTDENGEESPQLRQSLDKSPHSQITEAVLVKDNEDHFQVKVIKQILWVEGVRYELQEIYGIGNSEESGKECVICMTEPKGTAVLPCGHMYMCSECAKELRHQSDKCPICCQPIEELLEIKGINEGTPRS